MAVLVWLRAIERISVRVLGIDERHLAPKKQLRGMIAGGRRDHFGREPYPRGGSGAAGARNRGASPTRSRAPANMGEIVERLERRRACGNAMRV
jgi:hypothetical protein